MSKVLTSGSSILVLVLFITIASLKSIAAANLYNFDEHNGKISLINNNDDNNNNAASVRHSHLNQLNNNNHRIQRSVNSNNNYYDQQRNPMDYIVNPSDDNAENKKLQHERIPSFIDGSDNIDEDDNDDEIDDNDDEEEDDYDTLAEIIINNKLNKESMDNNKQNLDLYYRKRRQVLRNVDSNDKYLNIVKKTYPVKRNVDVMKMMEHQWINSDSTRPEKTGEQNDLDILFGLHKDEKKKNFLDKNNLEFNKKDENVQRNLQLKPTKNTLNMNSVNPTIESHFSTKNINTNNKNNNVNPTAKSKSKEELTQEQVHITSKKKKNIDWSQYFGIDKRMRQPSWSFAGKPGTQKEDDDWLIQHYYQTMAENLNNHAHLSPVNNNNDNNINNNVNSYKTLMKRNNENKIDNIVKYSRDPAADQVYEIDDEDTQKVKDKILSQLVAAYSLEKMRKALDELKHNIKIHQQQGESFDKDYRVKDPREKKNYYSKVNDNNYDTLKSRPYFFHQDKKSECPSTELEEIKQHCMPVNNYIGGQMLFLPCIRHQICKMCSDNSKEEKKCMNFFAIEAARICDNIEQDDDDDNDDVVAARESCRKIAVSITQIQIPPLVVQDDSLCYKIITHSNYNSCLKDFEQQEHHNYFNNNNNYYPYKM